MIGNYVKWNDRLSIIVDEWFGIAIIRVKNESLLRNVLLNELTPIRLRLIK